MNKKELIAINKKKLRGIIAAAGVPAVCIFIMMAYNLKYHIEPDMETLPRHIADFYNRGSSAVSAPPVEVYCGVSIGKNQYYMFEIGEEMQLGSATLEKGLNGRWRILHMGYGGGNFLDGIIEKDRS